MKTLGELRDSRGFSGHRLYDSRNCDDVRFCGDTRFLYPPRKRTSSRSREASKPGIDNTSSTLGSDSTLTVKDPPRGSRLKPQLGYRIVVRENSSELTTPLAIAWRGLIREERGSGTVMALGLILLGLALTLGVAQVGVASAGSASAHAASDLAAIAGATDVLAGGGGCGKAREYASKNQTNVVSCQVSGWMVTVEVVKPLHFGLVREARSTSRAGPEFAN